MVDTIEIAGKDYPVRFTLGALAKFERKTKVNAFALSDPAKLSSEAAGYLVWFGMQAGAKAEGVELDVEFMDVLDDLTLAHVMRAFELLVQDVPGEKKA